MKFIDRTGARFGRLVAVAYGGNRRWLCQCDCGVSKTIRSGDLTTGRTKSCGCLNRESVRDCGNKHRKHGLSVSRCYNTWHGMKKRCDNEKDKSYKYYGAKGIIYDQRWAQFENFLADMGEPPVGMSLDRIDSTGNYSKENCRWAPAIIQGQNKSSTKLDIDSVSAMKTLYIYGTGRKMLADQFCVSRATIDFIVTGDTWVNAAPLPV